MPSIAPVLLILKKNEIAGHANKNVRNHHSNKDKDKCAASLFSF